MNKEDLLKLYERRYFYELEAKESLNGRIQGTFFLLTALITVITYMVRMLDYQSHKWSIVAFYLCVGTSLVLLIRSGWLFYSAMWGNTYQALPLPDKTHEHRNNMISYKQQVEVYNKTYPENEQPLVDVDNEMAEFLYEKYQECATHNAAINMKRGDESLQAIKWLFSSALPLLCASALFVGLDMDVSSPRKAILSQDNYMERIEEVVLKLPNNEVNIIMSENNPPAPPAPPVKPEPVPFTDSPNPPKAMMKK